MKTQKNKIFSRFFNSMSTGISVGLRMAVFVMAAVCLLSYSTTAHAFGLTECAPSRKAMDLVCTANDVSITGIAIAPGGPTSCVGGSTINIDLDVTVNFAVPDRWDIGIFLVNDGKDPQLTPVNGGATSCTVSVLPTTLPFLNLDPGPWGGITDACGDGNSSINGGTGSGVLRINAVPVSCQAITNSGGNLYIPFVVSWDNQSSPSGDTCTSNLDPVPNTKSKCNSPDIALAAEVAYGTVNLVVLPAITKTDGITVITAGDTVNYSVVIANTTGVSLSGAVFTDPAVTDLTANSVSCAATGGATCPPSSTVAAMQGAGIAIPAMPVNSSVTFTVNATLGASAPAGALTNTATVTVSGQTNSVSDTDTVIAQLGVAKSFLPSSILMGDTSVMTITLQNTNVAAATGVAFTDNYPLNLVNTAAPGVTNTCGGVVTAAAGGTFLSLSGGTIPVGGSCAITVNVTITANGAYNNSTGIVTSNEYFGGPAWALLSVTANLSTSTKAWQDQNGGEQNPGDVMRYTITLSETAGVAATNVSVTDTLPATLTAPAMVACPAGATCGFAGQTLTVSNVTVPASGSVVIVFDAAIAAGTPAGTLINNCATATNPEGSGAAPCAPTITVSAFSIPATGNKPLYLYDAASTPAYKTSRAKPAGVPAAVTIIKSSSRLWTQSPALASPVTISTVSTSIPVSLYLAANVANASRTVRVDLACSGGGTTFTQTQTITLDTTPALRTFNLPITANQTCAAGQTWGLTVFNNNGGGGTQNVLVYPVSGVNYSYVNIPSQNVINVDSINSYNAAYPAVTTPAAGYYTAGDTVYVRAVVSDPFGSYDITSATVTIKNSMGVNVVVDAAMTQVADSGAATKTYEYAYTIPATGTTGWWTATVTAKEGAENTVSDTGAGSFNVLMFPSLTIVKSVLTYSDPVNGTTGPKAIPGSFMLYTVIVTNSGAGTVDNNTTVITDPLPANTELYVGDINGAGTGPVLFTDGAVASGLSYSFITLASAADSVSFSNNGGASYVYTPVPDVNLTDVNVTNLKISLTGILSGASGGNNPSFNLKFRVRVK